MHCCDLVDLGTTLVVHSPSLVFSTDGPSARGIDEYWTASKCRLDRWAQAMKQFSETTQIPKFDLVTRPLVGIQPMMEELFASELFTRVWTAILRVWESHLRSEEAWPVAHGVMTGHLEARNRALNLLVYGRGLDLEQTMSLNRLRRRTERWTDLLVGAMLTPSVPEIETLTFEIDRAKDYACDLRRSSGGHRRLVLEAALSSLRSCFRTGISPASPNADLNRDIAAATLACLPESIWDNTASGSCPIVDEGPADVASLLGRPQPERDSFEWMFESEVRTTRIRR